jgi:hypothetical protein
MSVQFDTFDTLGDRRELVILFQKLGEDLPEALARAARARWLESLIPISVSSLATASMAINPDACHPVGAYSLFIQIVGVLGVPIRVAAKKLDRFVTLEGWK